jgi:toxin ParE1/3/4
MTDLPFHPEATIELVSAGRSIERTRPGHGQLFFHEIDAQVGRAQALLQSGAPLPGFEPSYDVRRFGLARFPYGLIVAMVRGVRTVVAVAHDHRRPGYWRDRLEP